KRKVRSSFPWLRYSYASLFQFWFLMSCRYCNEQTWLHRTRGGRFFCEHCEVSAVARTWTTKRGLPRPHHRALARRRFPSPSANDVNVEMRLSQCAPQPHTKREKHLRAVRLQYQVCISLGEERCKLHSESTRRTGHQRPFVI